MKYKLDKASLLSILKGALIALSGTILVTLGDWAIAGTFDLVLLQSALAASAGSVFVNTGRKLLTE